MALFCQPSSYSSFPSSTFLKECKLPSSRTNVNVYQEKNVKGTSRIYPSVLLCFEIQGISYYFVYLPLPEQSRPHSLLDLSFLLLLSLRLDSLSLTQLTRENLANHCNTSMYSPDAASTLKTRVVYQRIHHTIHQRVTRKQFIVISDAPNSGCSKRRGQVHRNIINANCSKMHQSHRQLNGRQCITWVCEIHHSPYSCQSSKPLKVNMKVSMN